MIKVRNIRGWVVTLSGMGVNSMLGTLYAWGVLSAAFIDQLGWTATETQIPYMVACAVFALSMALGGRIQDMMGPRPVLTASAILAGVGFIFSGLFLTVISLVVFFGVVFGLSMGMGYASPTPAAVKWFEPSKRGVISGIVVSGFGLAPVYIAPLTTFLLERYGLQTTFYTLGTSFFFGILILSRFISNPPPEHTLELMSLSKETSKPGDAGLKTDYDWWEMVKTKQYYQIWAMFCFGTFAGLLIIGQLSKIGLEQAGIANSFLLIAIYAIFNALGRIGCGIISDKLGRMRTLFAMFLIQVAVYIVFPLLVTPATLITGIALVGFTFGGMLTLFPATTADYFGLRNFGVNFGLVITAWGIGGVFGPLLGGMVRDATGTYTIGFMASAVLSLLGALISLITKPPTRTAIIGEPDYPLERSR